MKLTNFHVNYKEGNFKAHLISNLERKYTKEKSQTTLSQNYLWPLKRAFLDKLALHSEH